MQLETNVSIALFMKHESNLDIWKHDAMKIPYLNLYHWSTHSNFKRLISFVCLLSGNQADTPQVSHITTILTAHILFVFPYQQSDPAV